MWVTYVRRTVAVTAALALVVFAFASTTWDSTQEEVVDASGRPRLGTALRFAATAYCKGETTAAGTAVRGGMAAADPALLPLGSVVRVDGASERYDGIWTVMDTGPEVKGRELDLYMWSCHDALAFGRKTVRVTILRLGWDPQQSAPGMIEQLFRRRERNRQAAPPETAPAEAAPAPDAPAPSTTPESTPATPETTAETPNESPTTTSAPESTPAETTPATPAMPPPSSSPLTPPPPATR